MWAIAARPDSAKPSAVRKVLSVPQWEKVNDFKQLVAWQLSMELGIWSMT
jgi:hypothetical protein